MKHKNNNNLIKKKRIRTQTNIQFQSIMDTFKTYYTKKEALNMKWKIITKTYKNISKLTTTIITIIIIVLVVVWVDLFLYLLNHY